MTFDILLAAMLCAIVASILVSVMTSGGRRG